MIGRGRSLPSVTAEEEVISVPMQNQKASDVKTNKSERKFEVKTRYFAATAEALTKQIFDSNKLKMHPKVAIKSDQTLDFLKHQRRNQNNW